MKLKDLLNPKQNKANGQVSVDVKKLKMKEMGVSVEDILEMKLNKTECKFDKFRED
jgi:hypothetical protein